MSRYTNEELLILTKMYPNPSSKYRELTCVAAVNRAGKLRRLFPVPYRLLDGRHQFKKWEWIRGRLTKATDDHRPESCKIDVDSIVRNNEVIGTRHGWTERLKWITPHLLPSFEALEGRRIAEGETLGFLRPTSVCELEIIAAKTADWTQEDLVKLMQEGLFDNQTIKLRAPLRKLPYDFYYHYEIETSKGVESLKHKITDWEAGALYWNCQSRYGGKWEAPFRQRLERDFAEKDLHFLMGTMHRFPDKWLIVGLVYPPKLDFVHSTEARILAK